MAKFPSKITTEALLAFSAISYAAGFATVLLHTGRLGAPVVELLEAANIVIGLPIAVVVVTSGFLLRLIRRRDEAFRRERQALRARLAEFETVTTHEFGEKLVVELFETMPVPSWVKRVLRDRVVARLAQSYNQSRDLDEISKEVRRRFAKILEFLQTGMLVYGLFSFALVVAVIPFSLWLYVWGIYPGIPQQWCGGRPEPIQLVVNSSRWSDEPALQGLLLQGKNSAAETRTTQVLELLFRTDAHWYVRSKDGACGIFAVNNDDVSMAVWTNTSRLDF